MAVKQQAREIKPWGYIHHSSTRTLLDRALCNSTITKKATANSDIPLYTADQLAQAVAVERERCIKACESERLEGPPQEPEDVSYDVAVRHCIEAIQRNAP